MLTKTTTLARVLVIRPGATEFDDQGRIKGSLDMPLSEAGQRQVELMSRELSGIELKTIYVAPCESARQTAQELASRRDTRIKVVDAFQNIDHGLWHGKLIDEVRRNHPRIYRTGIESPEEITPPEGEPIRDVEARVIKSLRKCVRKSGSGVIAIVAPDPLASIIQGLLSGDNLRDLWKSETDCGEWELVESDRL